MGKRLLTLKGPVELQTRFLYPFFFQRNKVKDACRSLEAATIINRNGKPQKIWEHANPHDFYKEELLKNVVGFLFQNKGDLRCNYFKLSAVVANRWLNNLEVEVTAQKSFKAGLVSPALIELFLSNYGVGVLSVAIAPDVQSLSFDEAMLFNYKLSQLRTQTAGKLRLPHPSDNKQRWDALSPAQKAGVPERPELNALLSERLGRPGCTLFLGELIEELLCPLKLLGLRPMQDQLSVYTVARFDDLVDFEKPEAIEDLAAFLSALVQIEEPTHAGSPRGTVGATNVLLNRRHWAGVGLLGCAHLVADQPPPEHPFNSARMPRIFLKYFIPYLVAVIQRTVLHGTIYQAGERVLSREASSLDSITDLREYLLEFAVEGYFTEVSYREAIHRFYRLAQEGLDVRIALDDARRAVSDIDATQNKRRQIDLAANTATSASTSKELQESMTENMRVVAKVQTRIEVIEVFLVSVYLAHLWHMFAGEHEYLKHWLPQGVLISAITGLLLGYAIIFKPWQRDKHK